MPSRINMGPDGGPYIAINENNGNIELEDNTGTTVAIWDDANSQWDFQNNPISNVDSLSSNSVNTDELNSVRDATKFDTAQAAIDDLPTENGKVSIPAGTFALGNISITEGGHTIQGVSSGKNGDDPAGSVWFFNDDTVTAAVDIDATISERGNSIKDLTFQNGGNAGTLLVRVDDTPFSLIDNVGFEMGNNPGKAIEITGSSGGSFSTVVSDCYVRQPNETPVTVNSDGGLIKLEHSTFSGNSAAGANCVDVERADSQFIVDDCDFNSGSIGLKLDGVQEPILKNARFEGSDQALVVGANSEVSDLHGNVYFANTTDGVRFEDARNCRVEVSSFIGSGDLVNFGANSVRAQVFGRRPALSGQTVTADSAANQPMVICTSPIAGSGARDNLPTGANYTTVVQYYGPEDYGRSVNPEGGTAWVNV